MKDTLEFKVDLNKSYMITLTQISNMYKEIKVKIYVRFGMVKFTQKPTDINQIALLLHTFYYEPKFLKMSQQKVE